MLEAQKNGSREKEIEEQFKKEREKLAGKINDLELKIYTINDEKTNLSRENKKLQLQIDEFNQKNSDSNELEINMHNLQKEKDELELKCIELEKNYNELENNFNEKQNNYDELEKNHNELENNYNELKKKYESLQEESNKNEIKLKTYTDKENLDINNENEKNTYIKKLEKEIEDVKLIIAQYENGTKISEVTKKEMKNLEQNSKTETENLKNKLLSQKQKSEKAFMKINEENSKIINELHLRLKEQEEKMNILKENLKNVTHEKTELENIIIKQESKVNDLGYKVNGIETLLQNKNDEIAENEKYSLKLINIINEQKKELKSLKSISKKNDNENYSNNNQINSLKAQIDALRKKLELKEDSINTIQKAHKILQEKYLKVCSNKRKKEQEELLAQAKKMKKESISKNTSTNNFKNKNQTISQIGINNETSYNEKNNKNDISAIPIVNSSNTTTILPAIKNLSSNNKSRIAEIKMLNEDDGKLDQINDMMSKIMDEL